MSEYVTVTDVDVGADSASGLAVSVTVAGKHYWVPYSQIRAIHRDRRSRGADRIEVRRWLAERENWDYEN